MPRPLTGSVLTRRVTLRDGRTETRYYARVCYTDGDGRRREIRRRARTRTEARSLARQIVAELEGEAERRHTLADITFDDWARQYASIYLVPPVYRDGRRIAGLRSWRDMRNRLRILTIYFGRKRLRDITYAHIEQFRLERLERITRTGKPPTVATVHRELALLRRVLNAARQTGLIARNPFCDGPSLIRVADERERIRVLTADEEQRLLAVCHGRRAHLRPLIIAALDTGARRGELLALRWSDINWTDGTLTLIQTKHTRVIEQRTLPLSARLRRELLAWRFRCPRSERVFPFTEVKTAFRRACELAGIADLRFHDLRHTAATRLVAAGLAVAEVSRILGHRTAAMTYRYINLSDDVLARMRRALDQADAGSDISDIK